MDPERWRRVKDLFQTALAQRPGDRPAFLTRACEGDQVLRQLVERLVAAHERAGRFLDDAATLHAGPLVASGTDAIDPEPTLPAYRAGPHFSGTDRFVVARQLGSGGMGVVYEAFDRARGEPVALKTLKHARPDDLFRLKREFRSLADIAHPNLVSLYELVVDETTCFFTMELVDGVHFDDYVNAGGDGDKGSRSDRARDALAQLVDGISYLHQQGRIHRDIKPSNILVTRAGRVVILDFGLSSDVLDDGPGATERMAGTPAYFAPERRAGAAPSPAQDWYSVGVTLYQSLTSRPPRERANMPADLTEICEGLLRRDPAARFTEREVGQLLTRTAAPPVGGVVEVSAPFVGRHQQLAALAEAWETVKQGRAVTVYVHGPSGIGKSALLDAFLDTVMRGPAVVLRGRCYEHEAVPYKGFDGVIDRLARYLRALPRSEARALLPADVGALSRIFPVLAGVGRSSSRQWDTTDPVDLRRRAFAALRELLSRLASAQPVVACIDDLHWADADSAVLLTELWRQPGAPPILTIVCARSGEVAAKPFLAALVADPGRHIALPLQSLAAPDAHALIAATMGEASGVTEEDVETIARLADGNPFLLGQLARHASRSPVWRTEERSFAEVLLEPLRALPPEAGAFLQMLALCGRPMPPDLVFEASGLQGTARPLLHRLRASHFVRSSGSAERVEVYHDRIQETLVASMAADRKRRLHSQMAKAMLARAIDDPEALYEHHREAGEPEAASVDAAAAARRADAALAFDRAAAYYQAALDLAPGSDVARSWREGLGAALANAGRPLASADAYLAAANLLDATRHVEVYRRAAEQFLLGGHIDRGLAAIGEVLRAVGLRLPPTRRQTLVALVGGRIRLRLRGLRFTERRADAIAAAELVRIDTCWSVGAGLTLVDNLRAADFHTRCLLLALEAGEPSRVARSLAGEVVFLSIGGGRNRRVTAALLERAREVAATTGSRFAIALTDLASAVAEFMVGEWQNATRLSERALAQFRQQRSGAFWETALAQNTLIGSLSYEGRLKEVGALTTTLLATARERGNAYWDTELRTRQTLVWLARDAPDEAVRQADEGIARWSREGFHRQHYNHVLAHVQAALYRGDAETAWRRLESSWKAIRRSHLLRVQWTRIEASYARARCALLMASRPDRDGAFLAIARTESRRIRRERMSWSNPIAGLLDAAMADLTGDRLLARRLLTTAVEAFDRKGMSLYAAAARRRLGALADGDEAAECHRRSVAWMDREGVVDHERMTRLIAPGFVDAVSPRPAERSRG